MSEYGARKFLLVLLAHRKGQALPQNVDLLLAGNRI